MKNPKNLSVFEKMKSFFRQAHASESPNESADRSEGGRSKTADSACCQRIVHIAYRGLSDDRLYLAENRALSEVKFFRPNGLRVFCAGCRKRLQ
jgi:hypothetical protein